MGRPKKSVESSASNSRKRRPALNPEVRESQLISLAVDLAEQQLLDGTASSQVITHFLKLGTSMAKLEKEKLEKENALLRAKAEAIESQKHSEELYANALAAMKRYSGHRDDEDVEVYDDDSDL